MNNHRLELEPRKKRIIALANRKGGSGKTATAVNLAACIAREGVRVLVVDLDPQAHATLSLGASPYSLEESVYDLLLYPDKDPLPLLLETDIPGLHLLPAKHDLAGAEVELVNEKGREYRLKMQLDKLLYRYDFILIDSPPTLGILTINSLAAAFEVLIPLQTHFLAMEGLGQLVPTIYRVTAELNPELRIAGIVATMCDVRTRLNRRIVEEVTTNFGGKLLESKIRMDVRLAEAPSFGQPIILYAPASHGAEDYSQLAREILAQS